jgi:hypothetical protein
LQIGERLVSVAEGTGAIMAYYRAPVRGHRI